jgi:CPA2 family monovalent cation:H+ antiporter-2
MHTTLALVLILLAAAVFATTLFRSLRLPALLGYVLVGIVLGPSGFDLAGDPGATQHLAEFGVVFLMFSIGLEFSLTKLRLMHRLVFGLGGLQVLVTLALVLALAYAAGLSPDTGIAIGGALAMSSTAIVSKLLAERNELDTEHGRQIIGVLLFQDLAVVPLLILIPALGGNQHNLVDALGWAAIKAILVLGVVLVIGQKLLRPWLQLVASRKSSELFTLNVLLITLGLAFITDQAGLSLALGAFVAGVLISETEYRYQVESDIRPFRDILMGLFFVTMGMALDLAALPEGVGATLAILAVLLLAKLAIGVGLAHLYSNQWSTALRTGLGLAQAGEFGLVLLALAGEYSLIPADQHQALLAAMVLSMLVAPFLIQHGDALARRLLWGAWVEQARSVHEIAVKSFGVSKHVILCGYGRSGQNLARILEAENVPFIALDHDPRRVKAATEAGDNVVFGDCTRREILLAAGIHRARALVVSFANTPTALQVIATAQQLRPDTPIIVRTLDQTDMERLREAGALEVVPEVLEGALMLGSQTLLMAGVSLGTVLKRIRSTREAHYSTMRGYFQGLSDSQDSSTGQERLASYRLEAGLPILGKRLGELGLENTGVFVAAVRRRGIKGSDPSPETCLDEGDILILRGTPEALSVAELKLGLA